MARYLLRSTLILCVWALAFGALALDLGPGSELLLTTPRALVGYGSVEADELVVSLDVDWGQFQVVVATPGRDVVTLPVEIGEGRIWVYERGAWFDLATLLRGIGMTLRLEFADGRGVAVPPSPGSLPPSQRFPVAGGQRPGVGDDDDGDDDGDDDDEDDDDDDEHDDDEENDDDDDDDDDDDG
jgi:hypothetical protein